jgi:DnaK suppressor protein
VSKPAVKKAPVKAAAAGKRSSAPAKKPAPARGAPTPHKAKGKAKVATPAKKSPAAKPAAHKNTTVSKKAAVPTPKTAMPLKKASTAIAPKGKQSPPAKSAAVKTAPPATAKKPIQPVAAGKPAAAPKPAAAAPATATAVSKVAVPVPTLVPGAPLALPNGFVPRKPGRGTPKYFVAPVQAPLPPPTSRFADRFAPPRPPTREMNKVENDTPRQAHKADPKLANAWKSKAGRDLSDDEVLAMPEAEYMNEKQLEFFRVKLQALKDDLLSNAGETTEHLREDTSIVPDPADRATIEEEHALELRTRDRERKLLKKISQSLGRIESGEYGFCDETGEPIGLGRLIARPTATLSLEAQQRRELKQKMFGD